MTMTDDFCDDFYDACSDELILSDYGGVGYCKKHQGGGDDYFWSYPYTEREKLQL